MSRAAWNAISSRDLCTNTVTESGIAPPLAANRLKALDPGTHLDLPGPDAARLRKQVHIGGRNCVGVEVRVLIVVRRASRTDSAVDDDMRDVDALGRELARHALRESAQRELAHRERRRLREPLDAGRSAGEEHRACRSGSMRRTACWATRKAAIAVTSTARATASASTSTKGPRTRWLAL